MTAFPPAAVLFDRDGTLVRDVPYNGDPGRVEPMPGALAALERLRAAGVRTAVVSNQSGVARGLLTRAQVDAVNRRVEQVLGPLGPFLVCEHGPDDGCSCRKPAPGMVLEAAALLGVDPADCALIGDIGADVGAALAPGRRRAAARRLGGAAAGRAGRLRARRRRLAGPAARAAARGPPTDDWERSTAGLETAVWATADMAYRRAALEQVGGFDERFPRAYREDADLGLRVTAAGWRIVQGTRRVEHPVRPAPWRQSIRSQRGNADDVLMRVLHGRDWRSRAAVPPGRRRWHLATTAALLAVAVPRARVPAGVAFTALTADFARRRIAPGPRTAREVATMTATSAVVPVAATGWWLTGWVRLPGQLRRGGPRATTS